MIEIVYGHEIIHDTLFQNKISIGFGLPRHGQSYLISKIEEEIDLSVGNVIWATMKWGVLKLRLPRLKRPIRSFKIAIQYWYPTRLALKCNPRCHAWLWWNF